MRKLMVKRETVRRLTPVTHVALAKVRAAEGDRGWGLDPNGLVVSADCERGSMIDPNG